MMSESGHFEDFSSDGRRNNSFSKMPTRVLTRDTCPDFGYPEAENTLVLPYKIDYYQGTAENILHAEAS